MTVFWEDLGLSREGARNRHRLAQWWDEEGLDQWLITTCQDHFHAHEAGVWFADRWDALLFKLTWHGKLPG